MTSLTLHKKIQYFFITTLFFSSLLTLVFATHNLKHHRHHNHRHHHNRHGSPSSSDNHEFLREHNTLRKAMGEPPYQWDKNLTRYAHRFASQRVKDCQMIHSNGPYGENIYWGQDYERHSAADAVRAWASEVTDYNESSNTCALNKMCGHYTQMIWKASGRLGCARVKCNDGGTYIICSYDPPGNYVDENPLGYKLPLTTEDSDNDTTPSSPTTSSPSDSS